MNGRPNCIYFVFLIKLIYIDVSTRHLNFGPSVTPNDSIHLVE